MFLEVQVLDWHAPWFKDLWREALSLGLVLLVAWRVYPSPSVYEIYFLWVRPAPDALVSAGLYPRFFRYLLGSNVNVARVDEALAAAAARRRARHPHRS